MKERNPLKNYMIAAVGSLIYAMELNWIITPLNLYSGGFLGIAQLIRTGLGIFLTIPSSFNLTGIIYYIMNIPLFIMAWRIIGKDFLLKTIITSTVQSFFLSVIPVAPVPPTDNPLTNCIIAGIIGGIGCGVILRSGCSSGGQDIVGICCAKRFPDSSVGKVTILMNIVVFGICMVFFNVEIVIYSIIYTTIMSLCVDHLHTQNINITVLIFSKKAGAEQKIMEQMRRGVTAWNGKGAYTREPSNVLCVVISKHEEARLKKIMREYDKEAFLIIIEGTRVTGNFEKRLSQ